MGRTLRLAEKIIPLLFATLLSGWLCTGTVRAQSTGEERVAQPEVRFALSEMTVDEDGGELVVEVLLTGSLDAPLSLQVVLQENLSTAESSDFQGAVRRTLTFEATPSSRTVRYVSFFLADDDIFEGSEQATFLLKGIPPDAGVRTGEPAALKVFISDDDRAGVVINEILPPVRQDANGDGRVSDGGESFVELLNTESRTVNLSGWTLSDGAGNTFTIPGGTRVAAGDALLLFAGEQYRGDFGGTLVLAGSSLEPGSGGEGGSLRLRDGEGRLIDHHSWDEQNQGVSRVREPEGSGTFIPHTTADGSGGRSFSPGFKSDGSYFSSNRTLQGPSGWRMLSAPVREMPLSEMSRYIRFQGFQGADPLGAPTLYTGYDGEEFTSPRQVGGTFRPAAGFLAWFDSDGESDNPRLPVTLEAGGDAEPAGNVTLPLRAEGEGWNIAGNPYGSPLDVSGLDDWARGGSLAGGIVQYWDGREQTFVVSTAGGEKVAPWQGFVIRNRDAVSLEIPESARMEKAVEAGSRGRFINFSLKGRTAEGTETTDRAAVISFEREADHGWDSRDAGKLVSLAESYAQLGIVGNREGKKVLKAQDSRPFQLRGNFSIPLVLQSRGAGKEFRLRWQLHELPEDWRITLTDRQAGREIDLRETDSYRFELAGDAPARPAAGNEEIPAPRLQEATPPEDLSPRFSLTVSASRPAGESDVRAESVRLHPNYPNPFTESTTIPFELSEESEVQLSVWNLLGQRMDVLVERVMEAGRHEMIWDPGSLPAGFYIVRLEVDGQLYTRRITLIK